ncbi:hypothetical protein LX32DRAFT_60204 [Colletotrichum zoysiae]|uniref:Uncharacterized protein n=1 Tax=Colletotrichum zoysiae TaxID=1216348 RepID=A0AAD9HST9_9PEZI|nr:hypothetical protein LX32DRAFT_60204 [Colletotrichum zoysiae]
MGKQKLPSQHFPLWLPLVLTGGRGRHGAGQGPPIARGPKLLVSWFVGLGDEVAAAFLLQRWRGKCHARQWDAQSMYVCMYPGLPVSCHRISLFKPRSGFPWNMRPFDGQGWLVVDSKTGCGANVGQQDAMRQKLETNSNIR